MKNNVKKKKGWFYRNDLWFSKAYRSLPVSARDLLQCFVTEINKTKKKYGRKWTEYNNGEISFTESQYRKVFGYSKMTYLSARNILIERGFLKITHFGGSGSGDRAKYEVLICEDMDPFNQRWRRYPKENWKHEVPKSKNNLIGKKTQWKKGQSGRKLDSTL